MTRRDGNLQRQLVAVVDQGSTSTKGAIYDGAGERLEESSAKVTRTTDGPSIQHDPEELARGVTGILDRLLERAGGAKAGKGRGKLGAVAMGGIAGIGLTCQRSTCLLWERKTGKALTPALSWQDTTQAAGAKRLSRHASEVARRTGLRLSPHYAALKLAHLLRADRTARRLAEAGEVVAGTLDAFLMHRLTDSPATEPGHAGRTLLYNLKEARWDSRLADLFHVPVAALPELRTSTGKWGEYRGVPVLAAAGDQQAALLGHGGWRPEVTAAHFGTGAFVLRSTGARPVRHPRLLAAAVATTTRTGRYQLEGSVNSAGSAVDWAARLTGCRLSDWRRRKLDPESLPWVLPAFTGLAAPWWEPSAQATVDGLRLETAGKDLFAATLCGVAMRVLDCVEALSGTRIGGPPKVLRVSGKLTRLEGLVGLLADTGQIPVEVSADEETGLLGISRLTLAGLRGSAAPLELKPPVRLRREPEWDTNRASKLRRGWKRFVKQSLA